MVSNNQNLIITDLYRLVTIIFWSLSIGTNLVSSDTRSYNYTIRYRAIRVGIVNPSFRYPYLVIQEENKVCCIQSEKNQMVRSIGSLMLVLYLIRGYYHQKASCWVVSFRKVKVGCWIPLNFEKLLSYINKFGSS